MAMDQSLKRNILRAAEKGPEPGSAEDQTPDLSILDGFRTHVPPEPSGAFRGQVQNAQPAPAPNMPPLSSPERGTLSQSELHELGNQLGIDLTWYDADKHPFDREPLRIDVPVYVAELLRKTAQNSRSSITYQLMLLMRQYGYPVAESHLKPDGRKKVSKIIDIRRFIPSFFKGR